MCVEIRTLEEVGCSIYVFINDVTSDEASFTLFGIDVNAFIFGKEVLLELGLVADRDPLCDTIDIDIK